MTPTERAEKIVNPDFRVLLKDVIADCLIKLIAAQIEQAIDEAFKEQFKDCKDPNSAWHTHKCVHLELQMKTAIKEAVEEEKSSHAYDVMVPLEKYDRLLEITHSDCIDGIIDGIEKACAEDWNKAIEQAAKICEDWPGVGGIIECDDLDQQSVILGHRKGFAKAIRAMRPEGIEHYHYSNKKEKRKFCGCFSCVMRDRVYG